VFDWYDGSNDYEGALLRTESEPPVFGDEGQMEEENMRVKIDGKVYDTAKAEKIATYDDGLPRMDLDYIREGLYREDGVLFLAGESGARGRYAKNEETGGKIGGEGGYILSLEEAKEWIELTQGDNAAIAMLLLDGFGRIRYDNSEACDSSKYSLGAGTTAEIWQAWEKDPGLEVTLYLTAKDGREIDFVRVREGCDVIAWIDLPAGSLRGVNVTDMPEELLAHRTLEEARTLGVDWGDCYPVCYDEDLTVDDVLDSNSWLLWEKASGEDLVIDDSYEYARPKTKKEKEEEEEEEEENE
jgi:hypothetical protein